MLPNANPALSGQEVKMGTRGLTAVFVDGAYRIAQYGQWDHYPSGQGVTALAFLHGMDEPRFREALSRCRWLAESDGSVNIDSSKGRYLTRDHGAKILGLVQDSTDPEIVLKNSITFAGDSLFCEYAYVIDLDNRTFEVFKGFNKGPVPEGERFTSAPLDPEGDGKYKQVRLLRSFSLDDLPAQEAFLEALKSPDDDE
jgi:hypothetical protein